MSHNNSTTPAEQYKSSPYAYLFEEDTKEVAETAVLVVSEETETTVVLHDEDASGGMAEALLAEGMTPRWKSRRLKENALATTYTRLGDIVEDWTARNAAMKMILKTAGDFKDKEDNSSKLLLEKIFRTALQNSSR